MLDGVQVTQFVLILEDKGQIHVIWLLVIIVLYFLKLVVRNQICFWTAMLIGTLQNPSVGFFNEI